MSEFKIGSTYTYVESKSKNDMSYMVDEYGYRVYIDRPSSIVHHGLYYPNARMFQVYRNGKEYKCLDIKPTLVVFESDEDIELSFMESNKERWVNEEIKEILYSIGCKQRIESDLELSLLSLAMYDEFVNSDSREQRVKLMKDTIKSAVTGYRILEEYNLKMDKLVRKTLLTILYGEWVANFVTGVKYSDGHLSIEHTNSGVGFNILYMGNPIDEYVSKLMKVGVYEVDEEDPNGNSSGSLSMLEEMSNNAK